MDTIRLKRTPDGWMAQWLGPHSEEVWELFGTLTLPTGYTAKAEASVVLAAIAKLNPGVRVELEYARRFRG